MITVNPSATRKYPRPTWVVTNRPAVNTMATATQAAAGAGIKNVCTGLTASLVNAAAVAGGGYAMIRDGATGAGTILWQAWVQIPAVTGETDNVYLSDLWIEGTANTAMTIEFNGAGGANVYEAVTMMGTTA